MTKKNRKDLFTVSLQLTYEMGADEFKELVEELISTVESQGEVTEVRVGTKTDDDDLMQLMFIGVGVDRSDEDEDF